MNIHEEVYEFAASAGALEGYVFEKGQLESAHFDNWIGNLKKQYSHLPKDVRSHFQGSLNRTLGRAVQSLIACIGADHDHVRTLKSMIKGDLPISAHDFDVEKESKKQRFAN
ncbi:uncharacterized protein Dvar_83050 [Desulfosarcina variabilis str. Montpellier]|uniref:hypothetical protein n=1 Tax=Desulfosarcina variabilis TaxID=2300 RepID=UPI003AFB1123